MNTELRKKARNDFEKEFFKLIHNSVSRKTMENIRKHRYIKLVTTEKTRNYLVSEPNCHISEPNYHTTNFFTENLLSIKMSKTQTFMNKPVYLSITILELSKIGMYEFWYDYIKPKHKEKGKLCYIVYALLST